MILLGASYDVYLFWYNLDLDFNPNEIVFAFIKDENDHIFYINATFKSLIISHIANTFNQFDKLLGMSR